MNRRAFLRTAAATAPILAVGGRLTAQDTSPRPVRLALVGAGNRGTHLLRTLLALPGVSITAVCDLSDTNLNRALDIVEKATGRRISGHTGRPDAYEVMLQRDDIDAVVIATPTKYHCSMAIAAMKAGKHVGSEVPAGFGLEELWQLVRTKEQTGRRYMLLENYLYGRRNMMIYNMARAGAFGDLYYAECSYIHDCRFMLFKEDGSLDWWGQWVTENYGNDYPTHALGPVSKWFGLNEGDRMEYCTSMMNAPRVLKEYAIRRFGPDSSQARTPYVQGEFNATLIHTAQGRVIRVDYDCNSPRPMSIYYLIQGTRGVYDSREGVFLEGQPEKWEDADKHLQHYDHGYWKRHGSEAEKAGHGGGDYFVLRDFVDMVRLDREPWIDVYDAASWSVIYHCSRNSIDQRSAPVDIPDFTGGRWKDPAWRKKHLRPA